MRSSLAHCAVVLVLIAGLSGCRSGGMHMPSWSNPFAKASPSPTSPDLPTAGATPTAPKGGYASAGVDSEAPRFTGSGVTPSSYDAPSQGPVVSHSPLDYAPPGSTVSAADSYMAPQVGRYDTGGGYGSTATGPAYNDPPPYMASRNAAAGQAPRDYSTAGSYDRYGNNAATTGGYGQDRYQTAPGYDTAPATTGPATTGPATTGPAATGPTSYQQNPYADPGTAPAPNWNTGAGTPYAPPTADTRTETPAPYASTAGNRYNDFTPDRPWNRDAGTATARDTTPSYDPGNTGYNPGSTNFDPGNTGYNPPNTPSYQSPAPPYTSPAGSYTNPAADTTAPGTEWRPGSTTSYTPSNSAATGTTGASIPDASTSYPSTGGSIPNSYLSPPSKTGL